MISFDQYGRQTPGIHTGFMPGTGDAQRLSSGRRHRNHLSGRRYPHNWKRKISNNCLKRSSAYIRSTTRLKSHWRPIRTTLTPEYLKMLSQQPFNRLSMGIQTFNEHTLKLFHRRHTAQQAIEAFYQSREAGFRNISIDLMYGLPGETTEGWEYDLQQALQLQPEHISAYHLDLRREYYVVDTPGTASCGRSR